MKNLLLATFLLPALSQAQDNKPDFHTQLLKEYDLSEATFDVDELLAPGVKKDGIPALTDPPKVASDSLGFLNPESRIAIVSVGTTTTGYPIDILTFHEIVNDRVGDVPVAVTYCPLCNSVSIFDRRIDGRTLDFGVSGFLLNSNVVMYDRQTNSLWSQVFMKGLSGPHAGKSLAMLPLRLVTLNEFRKKHPDALLMGPDKEHQRPYGKNPYANYFKSDKTYRQDSYQFDYGKEVDAKVLGIGIVAGEKSWFITQAFIGDKGHTLETPEGPLEISSGPAGLYIASVPSGIHQMQTFYHSWSAFFPDSQVLATDGERQRTPSQPE